jgi:adenosylmethionine-8-amino-7-oxononanoate aminotransferase
LGCAAGLASLDLLLAEDCQARIKTIETIHRERAEDLLNRGKVSRPRVTGTIAAVDLGEGGYASHMGPTLKAFFRDRGFLLRPLGPISYFLPPFCIEPADLNRAWDTLEAAIGPQGT